MMRLMRAAFLVGALFGTSVLVSPAFAQDQQTLADIRQELTVLHVDIQRLKRELSTTGGVNSSVAASSSVLDRVGAIEAGLQRLTAQTEQLEYRINRIVADGTNRIGDLEFRLVELEGGDIGALGETSTLGGEEALAAGGTSGGGQAATARVEGYKGLEKKVVDFPFAEVGRLTGLSVSNEEATGILTGLGFEVSGSGDRVSVAVPSWRPDVDGKADLVEEVMRIHGVDNIKPEPLPAIGAVNEKILTTLQIRTRSAKRALAARGMLEAVTWSFIPEDQAKLFGGGKPELKLANPIAADMSDMRPSLLPGLITAAGRNAARGYGDVALFEVSGTYED
ncbi:MAG: hypothetical protein P1U53_16975, partial [Sulfitobacter sp.]|nr:hypothetical protein [Sulfitobacter sp.]